MGVKLLPILCPALTLAGESLLAAESPIASRYPGDAGIKNDPAVIFADDFESWTDGGTKPPPGTWGVHKNKVSRTRVVSGKVASAGLSEPGRSWATPPGSQRSRPCLGGRPWLAAIPPDGMTLDPTVVSGTYLGSLTSRHIRLPLLVRR